MIIVCSVVISLSCRLLGCHVISHAWQGRTQDMYDRSRSGFLQAAVCAALAGCWCCLSSSVQQQLQVGFSMCLTGCQQLAAACRTLPRGQLRTTGLLAAGCSGSSALLALAISTLHSIEWQLPSSLLCFKSSFLNLAKVMWYKLDHTCAVFCMSAG